jgi:YHS domain-containing protein
MVVDPVCGMTVDPAAAAASVELAGERVYFCSDHCRQRFVDNPTAYRRTSAVGHGDVSLACAHHVSGSSGHLTKAVASAGLLAAASLLLVYFGLLLALSGWDFTLEQFQAYWPYIVALSVGFGIQMSLFVFLRRRVREVHSGKVVAATGTTSGVAMVSCCSHYLANLLPALGASGLVMLIGEYQIELFWAGLAANLAGIAYIGHRAWGLIHGA